MSDRRFCRECGSRIDEEDLFCPECGSRVDQDGEIRIKESVQDEGNKKKLYLVISIVAVVVLGAAIVFFSMKGKREDSAQASVSKETQEQPDGSDTEELGKAADINGVDHTKCTLAGTVAGDVISFEHSQSVYGYDEDGTPRYLEAVEEITIENEPESIDLADYDGREVEAVGQIRVSGEKAILKLLTIETTDGPLYDETEGGVHRYELVIKDCGWQQAYQESIQKGGYLVRINSIEEYNYLLQIISQSGYDKVHFYLGGRRDSGSQEYYWVDEENQTYGVRLNDNTKAWCSGQWMAGEPSFSDPNLNIDEAYLNIFYYSGEGRWIWNDGPENIPGTVASLSGYVGYIVEYED